MPTYDKDMVITEDLDVDETGPPKEKIRSESLLQVDETGLIILVSGGQNANIR